MSGPAGSILVIGNLTTDLILRGLGELPVWGQEVAGAEHVSVAAGQAAYLALGLAALGRSTRLVGIVGEDESGAFIRRALEVEGVDHSSVLTSRSRPTALTVALVRRDGERAFVSDFACQQEVDAEWVDRACAALDGVDAICLVGLFNLPSLAPEQLVPVFARARSQGVLTVLDTGWDPNGWEPKTVAGTLALLVQTDVFLPNQKEAQALSGLEDPSAAAAALQQAGAGTVVVKCGADGAVAWSASESAAAPATSVQVRDAVGAGDAFNAAFLFAHLGGAHLGPSLQFANAAAALYVSRDGRRHPGEGEVQAAMGAGARP